jgi:hypothetical protein
MEDFAQKQLAAIAAIDDLSNAIERRRHAESEVGKAQKALSAVQVKNATNEEALHASLNAFREVAMHW